MLLGKPKAEVTVDYHTAFRDGIHYISTSQWILAYATFSYLMEQLETRPALLYNMALCHFAGQNYLKAIDTLNQAEVILKSVPNYVSKQHFPEILIAQEFTSDSHLSALTDSSIVLQPNIIMVRFRRLLIDCHLKTENWSEVLRLSSLPDMEKCTNVQKAVAIAKTKA